MLPEPKILFQQLLTLAGTEGGARERFQLLVTDLVKLEHPTADEVAGPGGRDWGIDTFVGSLADTVGVWQSKFFLEWEGEVQRKQVRESFKQIVEKAAENNVKLDAWTLCIPCTLSPDERKWFDTWAAKQRREHGIAIRLWGGIDLRHKLMRADASDVSHAYFEAGTGPPSVERLHVTEDLAAFDDALFVRQLLEAGHVETDAARGLFFAADALFRDIASRGDEAAIQAMTELHLEVHNIWEQRFNTAMSTADADGRMAGLVEAVIKEAGAVADPAGVKLRPAHRRGVAHRLVEDARAGWVTHWREVATAHGVGDSNAPDEVELASAGTVES